MVKMSQLRPSVITKNAGAAYIVIRGTGRERIASSARSRGSARTSLASAEVRL